MASRSYWLIRFTAFALIGILALISPPHSDAQRAVQIACFSAVGAALLASLLLASSALGQFTYVIVDTGQAKCYDNRNEIAPPKPGQHTDEILAEWGGFSDGEISALRRLGAVG